MSKKAKIVHDKSGPLIISCRTRDDVKKGDLVYMTDDYFVDKIFSNAQQFHGVAVGDVGKNGYVSIQFSGVLRVNYTGLTGIHVGYNKLAAAAGNTVSASEAYGLPYIVIGVNYEEQTADIIF